jgi:hypothetical protein
VKEAAANVQPNNEILIIYSLYPWQDTSRAHPWLHHQTTSCMSLLSTPSDPCLHPQHGGEPPPTALLPTAASPSPPHLDLAHAEILP